MEYCVLEFFCIEFVWGAAFNEVSALLICYVHYFNGVSALLICLVFFYDILLIRSDSDFMLVGTFYTTQIKP